MDLNIKVREILNLGKCFNFVECGIRFITVITVTFVCLDSCYLLLLYGFVSVLYICMDLKIQIHMRYVTSSFL